MARRLPSGCGPFSKSHPDLMPKRFAIDTGLSGIVSGLHYPADRHSALQTLLILAQAHHNTVSSCTVLLPAWQLEALIQLRLIFFIKSSGAGLQVTARSNLPSGYQRNTAGDPVHDIPSCHRRQVNGGRIASQIAADPSGTTKLAGLVFLGYPLHPLDAPNEDKMSISQQSRHPCFLSKEVVTRSETNMRCGQSLMPANRDASILLRAGIIPSGCQTRWTLRHSRSTIPFKM